MSEHQSSSSMVPDKEQMAYPLTSSSFFDSEALEPSTSYCEAREEEEPLHHGSRHDSRIEVESDEDDRYSIQASCTDASMGSDYGREEETLYIQVIPHASEDSPAKRSFLCRCLAWSQDSLDERISKKNRRDDSSPTSHSESFHRLSFEQPLHRRQGSTESLHWEEKVDDPLDLINFIQSNGIAHT